MDDPIAAIAVGTAAFSVSLLTLFSGFGPGTLLMPVFAVILGVWLLDDPLGINKVAGGAMVVAGLAVINIHFSRHRRSSPAP